MPNIIMSLEEYRELQEQANRDTDRTIRTAEESTLAQVGVVSRKKKRKPSGYSKKYKAAFSKVKSKYKTKTGKWKKDGFKKAVRAAHKMAGGK